MEMSTKSETLRTKILKLGYLVGFTCVCWRERRGKLKVSPSRLRLRWISVQILLVLLYQAYLLYRSFTANNEVGGLSDRRIIRVRYATALWIFMNCNHVGTIWAAEYVKLMNGLERFKRKCAGTYGLHWFSYCLKMCILWWSD